MLAIERLIYLQMVLVCLPPLCNLKYLQYPNNPYYCGRPANSLQEAGTTQLILGTPLPSYTLPLS